MPQIKKLLLQSIQLLKKKYAKSLKLQLLMLTEQLNVQEKLLKKVHGEKWQLMTEVDLLANWLI